MTNTETEKVDLETFDKHVLEEADLILEVIKQSGVMEKYSSLALYTCGAKIACMCLSSAVSQDHVNIDSIYYLSLINSSTIKVLTEFQDKLLIKGQNLQAAMNASEDMEN